MPGDLISLLGGTDDGGSVGRTMGVTGRTGELDLLMAY